MPTERLHRPANMITWIMHNPLCSNIINWCVNIPPPVQHGLKLVFMWLESCRETISHIRMLKLIERDAGDKEGEQRQLFVTSLHLTGIIRYMKLKFLCRGSCWQHYFVFSSSPHFSFVLLFMLIWTLCFSLTTKSSSSAVLWFHSPHSSEEPVRLFNPPLPVKQNSSHEI